VNWLCLNTIKHDNSGVQSHWSNRLRRVGRTSQSHCAAGVESRWSICWHHSKTPYSLSMDEVPKFGRHLQPAWEWWCLHGMYSSC